MKVTVHPAAEQDLQEAASFYEREGSPALAARFVAEFKRLAQLLIDHPEIGSPRSNGRRGFAMAVFPYTLDNLQALCVPCNRGKRGSFE